ncbi:hypothetical protein [Dysgonomonas sp. 25]|uniref:hypothetical protein n=1 Tax=Dysgonomonas sp. 25 TaxID=2302933 RepID=UPI0013D68912|nr:hypothetical protein [Dysgonomonas sp. 25]NDV68990.1 hypothetical protein [Dysgonomonas sp. 25]
MKTFKFLLQTLLITIPLVFASCSSDDDFEIPTPDNSKILLSEYKIDYTTNSYGASFTYNSNNELTEAITYYYTSTGSKSYDKKYVFGAKTNNKKVVEVYGYSTAPSVWSLDYTTTLNYNTKGKITKIEDYQVGVDVNITWDGDRVIKTMPVGMPSMADSAQYYRGNYYINPDYKLDSTWDVGDQLSKTTATFSTYANYWQMIPVEFYALESRSICSLGAYFSDNAVDKTVVVQDRKIYTDGTKTTLSESSLSTKTDSHMLTFGTMSKRVPEKVVITSKTVSEITDHITPSNSSEREQTNNPQTITFTYINK